MGSWRVLISRLGDKPHFKEGGMLGTYSTVPGLASWAATWTRPDTDPQKLHATYTRKETTLRPSRRIRNGTAADFLSHLDSDSLSPFMLVLVFSS